MTGEEQLRVLRMVQDGTIGADDAERLLQALGEVATPGEQEGRMAGPPDGQAAGKEWARPWARYPLIVGSLITALGAMVLAVGYASQPQGGSHVGGYIILGLGLLAVLGGIWLATGVWLRLRIADARTGRTQHHFEIPLPLGLTAWAVRVARPHVRGLDMTGLDEAILALREGLRSGQAMTIDVAESDDGERIQVSLG